MRHILLATAVVALLFISALATASQEASAAWAPMLTTEFEPQGKVGQEYVYQIRADEQCTFEFLGDPSFLSFDQETSTLSGTPLLAGEYIISLKATSLAGGLSTYQNGSLKIENSVVQKSIDIGGDDILSYDIQRSTDSSSQSGDSGPIVLFIGMAGIVTVGIILTMTTRQSGIRRL